MRAGRVFGCRKHCSLSPTAVLPGCDAEDSTFDGQGETPRGRWRRLRLFRLRRSKTDLSPGRFASGRASAGPAYRALRVPLWPTGRETIAASAAGLGGLAGRSRSASRLLSSASHRGGRTQLFALPTGRSRRGGAWSRDAPTSPAPATRPPPASCRRPPPPRPPPTALGAARAEHVASTHQGVAGEFTHPAGAGRPNSPSAQQTGATLTVDPRPGGWSPSTRAA